MNLIFALFIAWQAQASDGLIAAPVTESSFRQILEEVNFKVAPMVQRHYGAEKRFLATGDWKKEYSPTSPGGSYYHPEIQGADYNDSWGVHITGWLGRWPGFNTDAIGFVLCHELGHHIAGGGEEVGADHFAPRCLRWIWSATDNGEWSSNPSTSILEEISGLCATDADEVFCRRVLMTYKIVEAFRTDLWTRLKVYRQSEIRQVNLCRQSAVLAGVQNRTAPDCRL